MTHPYRPALTLPGSLPGWRGSRSLPTLSLALASALLAGTPAALRAQDLSPSQAKPVHRGPGQSGSPEATFPSRNMTLLSWLPVNTFPGYNGGINNQSAADCWGYTSPSGREYALVGLGWGTAIVEVTNPASPAFLTTIPGPDTLWRDVTVIGTYMYTVSDGAGVGIQITDLSNVDSGQATFIRNHSQGGHTRTHTIVENVDSGYLYLCGGNVANHGLQPVTTAGDPTLPTFAGGGWTTQYVHEAQVVTYTSGPYAGREIAFLFAAGPYYSLSTGLAIADVTDKNNIITLANVPYPAFEFCHQGWISEDRKYLYVNDELDGAPTVPAGLTRVFDISDLSNPRLVSAFTNYLPSIDHNEYVRGRYLYQSNYTSGLRIWDLYNPLRPVEVSYIDTRPEDDNPTYSGSWGNYPFFDSGIVLISDMQRGLFIVKPSLLQFTPTTPLPTTLAPNAPTPVAIELAQMNATFAGAQLIVSINGAAAQAFPMTLQGQILSGELPAANCFDRVSYRIVATTDDNRDFTWPLSNPSLPSLPTISAYAQTGQATLFDDDFETDKGWTVQNTSLAAGAWARAVPLHNGGHGAVIGDADQSGRCFVTGPALNEDVDGGPTRLVSPLFDLSQAPEARIRFAQWVLSMIGATDSLIAEVSNNNGATWTVMSSTGPISGGWEFCEYRIADFVTPTDQVRIRFSISDLDNSLTEAGIDAITLFSPQCQPPAPCYANCDGSTTLPILNVADFGCFLSKFAAGDPYANCDGSTVPPVLNVADFGCFLSEFAAGCR